jgi:hypothetical protein
VFSLVLNIIDAKLMQTTQEKRSGKVKYDNRFQVSYPNWMYTDARKWAVKKGISVQDFQRKAMEFYLNHLNHDAIVFAQDGQPITRATIKNDVKRANSYQR